MSNHTPTSSWPSAVNAVNDGTLIDLTLEARVLGLRIPVVATPRVLEDCLLDGEDPGYEASVKLRLRLMSRLIDALLTCPGRRTPVTFQLDVQFKADPVPRWFALKAVRGPGDGGQPYLTVMMPDEE